MEKIIKIYDQEEYKTLLPGLKQIHLHKIETFNEQEIAQQPIKLEELTVSNTLTCSYCKINFDDCIQQRQHYKSDWHRYNLKQNLKKVDAITEEQFEQLADDVSSISGSDSDTDSDKPNVLYQGKVYFKNDSGKVFALYRSLIHEKKDVPSCDEHLLKIVRQCGHQTYWTLLMIGGGHFAGAVYNGASVLVHKTFHLYTCRAKQGGAQYKEGNARSAGASLRRYNELNLNQKIADLLETWSAFIAQSNLIFYRAAGPFNRTALFGGKSPVLKRNDCRLRLIPFCTKRATFTELKRVYDVLTNVEIYGSIDFFKKSSEENVERSRQNTPIKNKNINRAKSRESKELIRPIPVVIPDESSDDDSDDVLNSSDVQISFEGLKEFEGTRTKTKKKKKPKKKDRIKKWEETLKKDLNEACIKGNVEVLKKVLDSITIDVTEVEANQMTATKALNLPIDVEGNTALHVAALNNHNDLIVWLLENDSSPCNKNDKLHTPYTVNSDKSVRCVFRCFAAENPDKYNYPKSHIPVIQTTLTDAELTEKKKALRKAKREREKERRKENDLKRAEEENKRRYLKLSDREKRALAAERRILAQTSVVLVRCFLCGEDISGKVPFEYSGNRFCSISCLKAHRMQQPVVLS